ncbi:phage holin family protein [Arcanobacterium hippocoleae]
MTTNDHLNEVKGTESKLGSGATSIGELIAKITAQLSAIVRNEIKFAVLQGKAKITKLGAGGALFALAGILCLYLLGGLLLTAVHAFALILPMWLAYLIVSGILLFIIIILIIVGVSLFKSSAKHNPNPKHGFEKDLAAVKKGIGK